MTGHAHSPAEWAAFLSLAVGGYAALSVPYFVFVDADLADFDPRPAVWQASRSESLYPLLRGWDNARHVARRSLRDAALSLAALLLLLSAPSAPEATR